MSAAPSAPGGSVVPGDQALSRRCHRHLGGRRVEKPPGPFMREPLSWAQQDIRQPPGPQPDRRRGPRVHLWPWGRGPVEARPVLTQPWGAGLPSWSGSASSSWREGRGSHLEERGLGVTGVKGRPRPGRAAGPGLPGAGGGAGWAGHPARRWGTVWRLGEGMVGCSCPPGSVGWG